MTTVLTLSLSQHNLDSSCIGPWRTVLQSRLGNPSCTVHSQQGSMEIRLLALYGDKPGRFRAAKLQIYLLHKPR